MKAPVERPGYTSRLMRMKDDGNAKVLIGIRRSGKSTILSMMADSCSGNIICIDLDTWEGRSINTADDLMAKVRSSLSEDEENTLFIDEIQNVPEWEVVVRSLIAEKNCDIYLSGSNSKLLSGELATYLTGRTDTVNVHTLTLKECMGFAKDSNIPSGKILQRFIRVGGFPIVWRNDLTESESYDRLNDILFAIFQRDIARRHSIRNTNVLERIFDYICGIIGNKTSLNRIYETLHDADRSVNRNSVYEYIPYLEEACLIDRVKEVDLRGKRILTSSYKYYLSDVGIRNARLGYRPDELAGTVENIIYLELRSRGYEVFIGNNNGKEVDLVGMLNGRRVYIQACVRLSSESVIEREYGNLRDIDDNWPKYVVLLEKSPYDADIDGIRTVSLEEFLLSDID